MAAYANVAINDSGQTPESPGTPAQVLRTFVPGGKDNNGVWTWYDNTTGVTPATRSKLTLSMTQGNSVVRVKANLSTPKAITVDGITEAAHVTRGGVEFLFPLNGSRDDRRDIRILLWNFLGSAAFVSMCDDLEGLAA